MPEELEKKLKAKARSKGFTGEKFDAYVYGGLRNTGWKPKREKHGMKRKVKKHGLKRSQ